MALGKRCSVDNERKEDELMHETAKHEEVKSLKTDIEFTSRKWKDQQKMGTRLV